MKDAQSIDSLTVKSIFEYGARKQIHELRSQNCSVNDLAKHCDTWRNDGSVIVFTAGVFDILHVNHLLALTHYRLLGALEYIRRSETGLSEPSADDLHAIAASDKVRFILSVDSDTRVGQDKAFRPDKGDCPKPLVSWDNRVLLLARQHISDTKGNARPLVDFITKHGEGSCSCNSCPQQDNAYIAASIKPDTIIVSSSSPSTIEKLNNSAGLTDANIIIIEESELAYNDKLLMGPLKSSSIIKRAQSGNRQKDIRCL